ncbi:MAG: pyruvate, orthophosphate dikinase, partial [Pseudonocardiales bacterium]|nr:pyruvate, orthophosphate dikinase [Pseudonocardiales bacterium]
MTGSTQLDAPQVLVLDGTTGADKTLLGGKAWSIEKMRALDIPVPPAFALTTAVCKRFYDADRVIPADVLDALPEAMAGLEAATGRTFGGGERPLLVSVRSGAAISMPGMMDTVLNLGMTDDVQAALGSADPDYAADTRRRFIDQFAKVVGRPAPEDPWDQLRAAIEAVFSSWHSERAQWYRKNSGIPDDGGTAVTVQAMVFGNLDDNSGTGVLFTRDPGTGEAALYGDFMRCAQGEDVVNGTKTPETVDGLRTQSVRVWNDLKAASETIEADAGDMCDVEFTVQHGGLYVLQARPGQRSPAAAVRIAVEMVREGRTDIATALQRVTLGAVQQLQCP